MDKRICKKPNSYVICALICLVAPALLVYAYIALTNIFYMRHINSLSLPEDVKVVDTFVETTDEGGDRVLARAIVETDRYYRDVREMVERSLYGEKLVVATYSDVVVAREWPDCTYRLEEKLRLLEENKRLGCNYYVISEAKYFGLMVYMREWAEMAAYAPALLLCAGALLYLPFAELIYWRQKRRERIGGED